MGNVTVKTVLALPADAFLRKAVSTAHQQRHRFYLQAAVLFAYKLSHSLTESVGRWVGL